MFHGEKLNTGLGFGDGALGFRPLRSRKQKTGRSVEGYLRNDVQRVLDGSAPRVYQFLYVMQQLRRALNFIQNQRSWSPRKKPDRIRQCPVAYIRAFKRYVIMRRAEFGTQQGSLAGLSGTGNQHCRKRDHSFADRISQVALDIIHILQM